MLIVVAGPFSAGTKKQQEQNLDAMNDAAVKIYEKGHIPVIGVNAALPVTEKMPANDVYDVIMNISLAIVERCDALLLIGESPGANRERDLIISQGKKVFYTIDEIPEAKELIEVRFK
jgi:hypothetical protein